MNRRQLLTGVLAAPMALGLDLEAQEGAAPDPSLYIPKSHLVEDRAFLHDFMHEYAFVDLVTTSPTLRITHIPTFLERASGRMLAETVTSSVVGPPTTVTPPTVSVTVTLVSVTLPVLVTSKV